MTQAQGLSASGNHIPLLVKENGALVVSGGRGIVTTEYVCKTQFSGAVPGDLILAIQIIDFSVDVAETVETLWRNITTSSDIYTDPSSNDIEVQKQVASAQFYSVGYTLNAAGEIASESESNGTVTRTRTWSSVTNPDGSTTFTASAWSYA